MNTAVQFASILREVSLDNLAEEAHRPPRILVIAPPTVGRQVASELLGPEAEHLTTMADSLLPDGATTFDIVLLVWDGANAAALREQTTAALQRGWPMLIVSKSGVPLPLEFDGSQSTGWPGDITLTVEDARLALVRATPEPRWTALGRYLPSLRAAASRVIVMATARVNGQWSGLSGAATLVPIVGSLMAIGADFIVLAKNQALMLFKLAAVHGRDLDDRTKLYLEMASVLGAGLVMRTVARQLITAVPGPIGLIPRVGISYGGTLAIGMAAHRYYSEGHLPTQGDLKGLSAKASGWVQSLRGNGQAHQEPVEATVVSRTAPITPPTKPSNEA